MSETVFKTGKLIPVKTNNMTLDEKIQEILGEKELDSMYSSWLERLYDLKYDEYYWDEKSKTLYKIKGQEADPSDFIVITSNHDGSYNFTTSYYNGGTCLGEMIEEGFEKFDQQ